VALAPRTQPEFAAARPRRSDFTGLRSPPLYCRRRTGGHWLAGVSARREVPAILKPGEKTFYKVKRLPRSRSLHCHIEITRLWSCISKDDFTSIQFVMPTILQSIQTLFNDHQARLAAVSAAPGVVGLSLELDQMSATYLSKAVQILVRPKYAADSNTGTSPEDKISSLASSVSRLSKQVRPLAPNDAFYSAFTSGSVAAAQDVFLSIFGLTMPS
jgi:hypothetical protein